VVTLDDLAATPARDFTVTSLFDLGDVGATALGQLADLGDCPHDPAQRLLDTILPWANAPTVASIEAARSAPDASGCRLGGADEALATLLEEASPAAAALLEALQDVGDDAWEIAASLTIDSALRLEQDGSGAQRLDLARFAQGGAEIAYALGGLPAAFAPLRATVDFASLAIGPHAFSLRVGTLLARALGDLALGGADVRALAVTLAAAPGCEAVEDLLCEEADRGANCLAGACAAGAAALDQARADALAELDGAALDFTLSGSASLVDQDGDGVAEALADGAWSATVGDEGLALAGRFQAEEAPQR
ncbi:MAG: hypothetical protein AABZ30_10920, partial [Myxococcota bacterium]